MSFTAFLKVKTTKYVDFRVIGFLDAGSIPATSTKIPLMKNEFTQELI